jgi:hypothetical protein
VLSHQCIETPFKQPNQYWKDHQQCNRHWQLPYSAAYHYWKDLWANPQKSPKPRRTKTLPVYLEPEEQQALMEAAVAAGVPRHLAEGDKSRQVSAGHCCCCCWWCCVWWPRF